MDIRTYISGNYYKIKNTVIRICKKDFNEDIFHDTLYKVINIMKDRDVDDSEINYIISAFRTNVNREKIYAYNRYRTDTDGNVIEVPSEDGSYYSGLDGEYLLEWIETNFGKTVRKCFVLWVRGYTVQELQDRFQVKSLYYKFGLIKQHISQLYPVYMLLLIINLTFVLC